MIRPEVESIVALALDLPLQERSAFVDARCGDDATLKRSVCSLLSACVSSQGLLSCGLDGVGAANSPNAIAYSPDDMIVPGFRIVRPLGQGGMGAVFLAEQDRPRRLVAVKVVMDASPAMLARFDREGDVLAQMHHPGIAQVHVAGLASTRLGERPFLAMELVDGLPLDEYVRMHANDVEACLELMAFVCDAVHHAHERGIVHRDLKPANVLVQPNGHPKVLDFGIARLMNGSTGVANTTIAGAVLGTVRYMSPEQAAGETDAVNARADVYALGVMTYELVTGASPFDFESVSLAAALRMIRESEPREPKIARPGLSGDVNAIIRKAMARKPAQRFSNAGEMATALRAKSPPLATHAWRPPRRRWAAIIVGAALMAILAFMLANRWMGPDRSFVGVGTPGFDGEVRGLALFDFGTGPELVAAGTFTHSDGILVAHVARWFHGTWSPLGDGVDGPVWAMQVFDDGSGPALFVAGQFSHAGGRDARNIAKWDGRRWWPVGEGIDGHVKALTVYRSNGSAGLYAGGSFHRAGDVAADNIARWDGHAWFALDGHLNNDVRAMATFDGSLYVGGDFDLIDDLAAHKIARWNGSMWSAVGAEFNNDIKCLAVCDDGSGAALYAGGAFTRVGDVQAMHIARWQNQHWSGMDSEFNNDVHFIIPMPAMTPGRELLLVGGQFSQSAANVKSLVAWSGKAWIPPPVMLDDWAIAIQSTSGEFAGMVLAGSFSKMTIGEDSNAVGRIGFVPQSQWISLINAADR